MMSGGFFVDNCGTTSGNSGSYSDVRLEGEKIIFSPTDPIYIDDTPNVFYSTDKKNAYLYVDESGNIFARKVNN